MIKEIKIRNYKCFDSTELSFGKLNIITGLNSVGKSSLIQSILDYCEIVGNNYKPNSLPDDFHFNEVRNINNNAREIEIAINGEAIIIAEDEVKFDNEKLSEKFPVKNKGLYYLSATRIGPEDLHKHKKGHGKVVGDKGESIFSVFENYKDKPIVEELIKCDEDFTLSGNLNFWLKEILNYKIQLNSEVVTSDTLKINYKFEDLPISISPRNLGAGVTYLAQIIILFLLAKPGEIVIIENPEIHLHPAAQSKLGAFFAFIASKGIQVFIETHCEHLINRIRYEVGNKKTIENEQVKIFYKSTSKEPFEKIYLNSSGHYINEKEEQISFPTGFFDSTLKELLELG